MKKLFILSLFFSVVKVYSQDCQNFYYMINNAEVQMTVYNAKGAKTGLQTWKISDVSKEGSGFRSTVSSRFVDEKGREIAKGSGVYKCNGGKLLADMRMTLPQDQTKQSASADAKINESFIEYPSSLSDGMQLPDAFFKMEVNTTGIPSTTNYEMNNRKVVGKEKITSDAGSWDAYKITYDAEMNVKMAGVGFPLNMKVIEWFVPDFGMVKSETYNKKGKLMGYTLLTRLKK